MKYILILTLLLTPQILLAMYDNLIETDSERSARQWSEYQEREKRCAITRVEIAANHQQAIALATAENGSTLDKHALIYAAQVGCFEAIKKIIELQQDMSSFLDLHKDSLLNILKKRLEFYQDNWQQIDDAFRDQCKLCIQYIEYRWELIKAIKQTTIFPIGLDSLIASYAHDDNDKKPKPETSCVIQ